ncbi:STAS-like domain-containing protein [Sphingomonas sp. M1A8_2b]
MFRSDGNVFTFSGNVGGDPLPVLAALHTVLTKQGYSDVVLDFDQATFVSAPYILPIVVMCRKYRLSDFDFDLILPSLSTGARLLQNTDWAHLIDPKTYGSMAGASKRNLSATAFATATQAHDAVDTSIRMVLGLVSGLDRSRIVALQWAIDEVVDNVLNHAASPVGGIIQVMTYPKRKQIEFYVCDAGMTIPRSLRQSEYGYDNDAIALRQAINEGVTKNKQTNRGNGLFGTFRCCEVSGGEFDILSGNVSLKNRPASRYQSATTIVKTAPIPFNGTFVRACINWDYNRLLEEALVFKGKAHVPSFDIIEKYYEADDDSILFKVKEESYSFGTREAGRESRNKAVNLMDNFTVPVTFDFEEVFVISSSYADEVFGKLLVELGEDRFNTLCRFTNMDRTIKLLIDRAIRQRLPEANQASN